MLSSFSSSPSSLSSRSNALVPRAPASPASRRASPRHFQGARSPRNRHNYQSDDASINLLGVESAVLLRKERQAAQDRLRDWLGQWDNASKKVRVNLLREFILNHANFPNDLLEAKYGKGLGLMLSRLTAWLRLTYLVGVSIDLQIEAIHIIIHTVESNSDTMREFLASSTVVTVLELIAMESSSEAIRIAALKLLITLAKMDQTAKTVMCDYLCFDAIKECMTYSYDLTVQETAGSLIRILATENPAHATTCSYHLLSLLEVPNVRAKRTASVLVEELLDISSSCLNFELCFDEILPEFIDPTLYLLQEQDAPLQIDGESLVKKLLRSRGLFSLVTKSMLNLLYTLRLESQDSAKAYASRNQETLPASTRIGNILCSVVESASSDELSTLCYCGLVKALVGSMLNIHNYELQRTAIKTCRALCQKMGTVSGDVVELLGQVLHDRILNGSAIEDGLVVRDFIQDEALYSRIAANLQRKGWDLRHALEDAHQPKPDVNSMLAFPDDGDDGEADSVVLFNDATIGSPGSCHSLLGREDQFSDKNRDETEDSKAPSLTNIIEEGSSSDLTEEMRENESDKYGGEQRKETMNDESIEALQNLAQLKKKKSTSSRRKSTNKYTSFRDKLNLGLQEGSVHTLYSSGEEEDEEAEKLSPLSGDSNSTRASGRLPGQGKKFERDSFPLSKDLLKARTDDLLPFVGLYVPQRRPHPKIIAKHAVRFTQKYNTQVIRRHQQAHFQEERDEETMNFIKGLPLTQREELSTVGAEEAKESARMEVLANIPLRYLPSDTAKEVGKQIRRQSIGYTHFNNSEREEDSLEAEVEEAFMTMDQKRALREARAEAIRVNKEKLRKEKAARAKEARILARKQKGGPEVRLPEAPSFQKDVLLDLAIRRANRKIVPAYIAGDGSTQQPKVKLDTQQFGSRLGTFRGASTASAISEGGASQLSAKSSSKSKSAGKRKKKTIKA